MKQQDYLVCVCMGVMYSEIYETLMREKEPSFALAVEKLQVATGCNSCVDEVHAIVDICIREKRNIV